MTIARLSECLTLTTSYTCISIILISKLSFGSATDACGLVFTMLLLSNHRTSVLQLTELIVLFEKLVYGCLETFIGGLVHGVQHGFRSGRSTSTNLTLFVDSVLKIMSIHGQADVIYTDFSKAFGRVNHKLVIQKLRLMVQFSLG